MCPKPGALSCGLQRTVQSTEATTTQGLSVCSSTLSLKQTWNTGFLQGQGQRAKLRPSESVEMRAQQASHLCWTPACCCLRQDAFFDIRCYFWLSPRSSSKREQGVLPEASQTPADRWGSCGCTGSTLSRGPVTFPSQAPTDPVLPLRETSHP